MYVSIAWFENRSKLSHDEFARGIGKRFGDPDKLKDGARRVMVLGNRDGWMMMTFFDSIPESGAHISRLDAMPEQTLPPNARLTGLDEYHLVMEVNA